MRIAFLYGPMCLTHRGSLELEGARQDPRGLSGSEWGIIRTAEEMAELGHEVELFTFSPGQPIEVPGEWDVAISWNEPDTLKSVNAKLKVCEQMLNSFEYCSTDMDRTVDLWTSPSDAHRQMVLSKSHEIGVEGGKPAAWYSPEGLNWRTVPLGCDLPSEYPEKVPGRVIYTSSPDRGLHWLLQEWPAIKRAVPHASLRIFYRLQPWIDGFKTTPFYPPIERLRQRSVYIEDALRRLRGMDVEVVDQVSRERIQEEQLQAEVLAYPCDPIRWTEGFSCSILEACAAKACPVVTDVDALGDLYGLLGTHERGEWGDWRYDVIRSLKDEQWREERNERALLIAEEYTWEKRAKCLERLLLCRTAEL